MTIMCQALCYPPYVRYFLWSSQHPTKDTGALKDWITFRDLDSGSIPESALSPSSWPCPFKACLTQNLNGLSGLWKRKEKEGARIFYPGSLYFPLSSKLPPLTLDRVAWHLIFHKFKKPVQASSGRVARVCVCVHMYHIALALQKLNEERKELVRT